MHISHSNASMHIYGKTYKNDTDEPICKAKIEKDSENKYMDTKGEKGSGMNWEIAINIYTLLCIKQTTNDNRLYSTGNSTQCSVVT